jgi:autotransporter-associated beta strand protein
MSQVVSSWGRGAAHKRLQALVLAVGAAASVGMTSSRAMAQYVWTGTATGNFSNTANWLGGIAPPTLGSATTSLLFSVTQSPSTLQINAVYDTAAASVMQVNSLTFDLHSAGPFQLQGSPNTNLIQMSGVSPTITFSGNTTGLTSNASSLGIRLAADTTIYSPGTGYSSFNGIFTDDFATSGIHRTLTVAGTPLNQYAGTVFFNNANAFGGLNIDGGNVQVGSGSGLGPAGSTVTVTSNGGVLSTSSSGANGVLVGTIQLNGRLSFVSVNTMNIGPSTVIAGAGSLAINAAGASTGLFVQSASTNSGDVTIDMFKMPNNTSGIGGLGLQGSAGSMLNVNTFNVRAGGQLWENNAYNSNSQLLAADKNTNSNRINDTATLNLNSGIFRVSGSGTVTTTQADVSETVGTINGAGNSTIWAEASPGATKATTINIGTALNRVDHGTFIFRGNDLGNDGVNAGVAAKTYITVPAAVNAQLVGGGGAAGSTSMSILPFAVAETYVGSSTTRFIPSFATIGATGVRGLTTAEYATALGGSAQDNVLLTTPVVNTGTTTMNSLLLGSSGPNLGTVDGSVSGGTLNITTGAIIAAGNTAAGPTVSSNINFGATDGKIYTGAGGHAGATGSSVGSGTNLLTISGNLIGSGGLTKFGPSTGAANNSGIAGNTLALTGDNSGLTGTLTLNSGFVDFNAPLALPGTGQIVSNGSFSHTSSSTNPNNTPVGLTFSGSNQTMDLFRDIAVNSGWMGLRAGDLVSTNSVLTVSGQISGPGGVFLYGRVASNNEVWLTNTNNTYTGTTRLMAGRSHIASDGSLGNGGALALDGGTLVLEGDWTTNRLVSFTSNSTIDTNGHNAVLSGMIANYTNGSAGSSGSGSAQFIKAGLGTITITGTTNQHIGIVNVNGGTMLVNGSIAPSSSAFNVNNGGTLGGSGSVYRSINVASGGTLSPGISPGILTEYGNLSLATGSIFAVDLNGPTAGNGASNYDRMAVNGTIVSLNGGTGAGSTLSISLGYFPDATDTFFILTNDGTDALVGTFNGLADGSSVLLGYSNWGTTPVTATISYLGNSATGATFGGNDVVLYNIIPAPGAAGLLALGGLMTIRRRRTSPCTR